MRTQRKTLVTSILAAVILTATASAQQAPSPPPTTPYGAPLGLDAAKKVMAAAEAEAVNNNWAMAIVILDSTGHMVMLHKLDNTQYGSLMAAEDKALSAINYRRPSKVFEDLVAQGGFGLRSLALRGASPWKVAFPLMWMARLSGRSASLAARQFRMAKSQRRVPTQRSETHHPLAISRAVLSGGLNACFFVA